jgi:hypothetical protein
MLCVLFDLRLTVKRYCQNYKKELKKDILTSKDWKKLCTIKEFFASFTQVTLAAKGLTSFDFTFFIINILIRHF